MTTDFLDRETLATATESLVCRCTFKEPASPACELHRDLEGFRCDHQATFHGDSRLVYCPAVVRGRVETREQRRALTMRAESIGWQAAFFDGRSMHFCPDHRRDESYPVRRSLK